MLTTFAFRIHHEREGERFMPFLARDVSEAFKKAQVFLADDAQIQSVEVLQGIDMLFSSSQLQRR